MIVANIVAHVILLMLRKYRGYFRPKDTLLLPVYYGARWGDPLTPRRRGSGFCAGKNRENGRLIYSREVIDLARFLYQKISCALV